LRELWGVASCLIAERYPRFAVVLVAERLPELLDTRALMAELNVKRGVAESIIRQGKDSR
jgi:hypothetical protein